MHRNTWKGDLFEEKTLSYLETLIVHRDGKGCKINLLGLNSGIFAGYDGDDRQKLALGFYQVEPLIRNLKGVDLSIGFFHHPFSCHHREDRVSKNALISKLDLILTGHLHEPDNEALCNSAGQCVIIGAGAAFETRESANSFNLVEIDTDSGKGKAQFFKYLSDHNTWKEDTDVNPRQRDGAFSFQIRSMAQGKFLVDEAKATVAKESDCISRENSIEYDPIEVLDAYRNMLKSQLQRLPLRGIDIGGSDPDQ